MLCANQWFMYAQNNEQDEEPTIVEIFKSIGDIQIENEQEKESPLVSQAGEYALIINPPKPPNVKKPEPLQPRITQPPVAYAPKPSAKFKLLSTSYNRDQPEDSVALISEPGKGEHWAKVGDIIGNFVLEEIKSGVIIYRYGSQANEMAVETKPPVRIVKEHVPHLERRFKRVQPPIIGYLNTYV
jgi:hypothetical protein